MTTGSPAHFADRLAAAVQARSSSLVLGLDPDPARLWPAALEAAEHAAPDGDGDAADTAAAAVVAHCALLIEAAGPACVAIKPQLACFERLGAAGWAALGSVAMLARRAGLLVLADGKRGDVPVTASAYAQALLGSTPTPWGPVEGLAADAVTANPLMGADALEPLVEGARAVGAGVFVLVRTSNPGAADVEDLELAAGGPLWHRLAGLVREIGGQRIGACGLADVGAVVGATVPEHVAMMRELMPHAIFLLPGVGAQGGRVEDLAPAWSPGPAGGLVTASRSIATAGDGTADPGGAAREEAERLRSLAWSLAG